MRASFALHAEIAEELGAERIGYRPMDALMTAAADEGSVEPYRRLESPAWLDGNVAVHEVIGDTATTAQVNPLRVHRGAGRGRRRPRRDGADGRAWRASTWTRTRGR